MTPFSSGKWRVVAAVVCGALAVAASRAVWADPPEKPQTLGEWLVGGAAKLAAKGEAIPVRSAIEEGSFTASEKQRLTSKVDEVLAAAESGKIPSMRSARILTMLLTSRLWQVDTIQSVVPRYVEGARIPDAEKAAMRNEVNRYARALWLNMLTWDEQEKIWAIAAKHMAGKNASGSPGLVWVDQKAVEATRRAEPKRDLLREMEEDRNLTSEQRHKRDMARMDADMERMEKRQDERKVYKLKPSLTTENLKKFIAGLKHQADDAGIEETPPRLDAVGDTLRAVDKVLSGNAGPEVDEKMVAKGIGAFLEVLDSARNLPDAGPPHGRR